MWFSIKHFFALYLLCTLSTVLRWQANGFILDEKYESQTRNGNVDEDFSISLQHAPAGAKRCMGKLGCFVLTEDFFRIPYRPYNLLPQDRQTINTKFFLYTRENPKDFWMLDADNSEAITRSPLNAKHPTRFIVHGFLDTKWYAKWLEILKDNLLLHSENNVIVVDWSGGNSLPYSQATANTRVVGAEIALMMLRLQEIKGISTQDCHIIGHSLGAHVAGYAGDKLKEWKPQWNIGRISGIDPAEPFFQNMPPAVRLDPTDANFVDAIHTDSVSILLFGLGMSQPVGHVDFYPNNGKDQPGCKADGIRSIFVEGLFEATRRFVSCNHQRAVDFYIYSINYRRAPPVGRLCPSWKDYERGFCMDCGPDGSKCAIMGLRADEYKKHKNNSESSKFYLKTSGISPYWIFQYEVTVKLAEPKISFKNYKGKLTVTLYGEYGDIEVKWPQSATELVHGASYSFIAESKNFLGTFDKMRVSWTWSSWLSIFGKREIRLEYVKLVPLNLIDKTEKKLNTRTFCRDQDVVITSGKSVTLPRCSR